MTKVINLHPDRATFGEDALERMDDWKSDMTKQSKAVIIYSDEVGAYHTYAVNCNMAEAVGFAAFAKDMLLHQVRPQ